MLSAWFQHPGAEGRVEGGEGRVSQIRPGALPFPRCRSSVTGHHAHPTVLGAGLGAVNSSSHPSPSLAPFHSLVFTKDKRGREFTWSVSPAPNRCTLPSNTHLRVSLFNKKRNSFHTIRHFKMEPHHLGKPRPASGSRAAATTGVEKNRRQFLRLLHTCTDWFAPNCSN